MEHIIKESSLDYVQDIQLARACKEEVSSVQFSLNI